jgi:hypothetical protein
MVKSKKKPAALEQRVDRLEIRFPGNGEFSVDQLSVFNTKQHNRILALEEAICPRVAARLTVLERHLELQKGENQAVFQRLNTLTERVDADDLDKKRVFDVLASIRNTVLARVQVTEQDISAINKSVAILSSAIQSKPDVTVKDTPELRQAFSVTAPSKATNRGIVSHLITAFKREIGLEFTEQGMKRIIELIEKA